MKYRMLTKEEQEILDEDFKHFLITNGVTNEEWLAMNANSSGKAVELVELFSDIVLEKVYQKLEFLEFRSPTSCLIFRCTPDQLELISIVAKADSRLDLSTAEGIHAALVEQTSDLEMFRSKKPYSTLRELEIHKMVEQGCLNSSKEFWEALEKFLALK